MNFDYNKKNVLITGGSRGIGKAIATAFQKENANVGIVARNNEELQKTAKELGIKAYRADLSIKKERESVFHEFINEFGTIDILINNAGASHGGNISETDIGVFETAMQLNFIAAVHLSQLAVETMKRQNSGTIINITSIYGREAGGRPTYNAAKAALISFTKSLGNEAIKDGIRVNGIAPGAVFHLNKAWKARLDNDPDSLEKYAQEKIPAGRFGTPEDIADAVLLMSSEKARWIVGTTLNVDGGQSHLNF